MDRLAHKNADCIGAPISRPAGKREKRTDRYSRRAFSVKRLPFAPEFVLLFNMKLTLDFSSTEVGCFKLNIFEKEKEPKSTR